jgi:hypothetical protein
MSLLESHATDTGSVKEGTLVFNDALLCSFSTRRVSDVLFLPRKTVTSHPPQLHPQRKRRKTSSNNRLAIIIIIIPDRNSSNKDNRYLYDKTLITHRSLGTLDPTRRRHADSFGYKY